MDYFPGHDCVDVLALDCYGAFEQAYYDDMNALSDGKVMGIGETYNPPAPDVYQTQPKWSFFMRWAVDIPTPGRPPRPEPSGLRALMNDPRMLSRNDPAYWSGINPVRAAAGLEPITSAPPSASTTAP